ncbi:MAG: hypothetical protein ACPGF6_04300 [Porticoccaceae bacterium]
MVYNSCPWKTHLELVGKYSRSANQYQQYEQCAEAMEFIASL